MYVRSSLFALAAVAVLMSSPAAAQTAQAPPTAQPNQKPAKDPNEIVCEKQKDPSSWLVVAKVCHTRAEWADLRHQDRQMVDEAQIRRGMGR